jgi:hypothetical protein
LKNVFRTAVAIVIGIVLAVPLISVGRVYQRASEAARLIAALREINIGSSTEAQAAVLISPFNRLASERRENEKNVREVSYIFYNTEMERLRLAPYAHLQVILIFQNGVAASKSMSLFVENGYAALVQQDVWLESGDAGTVGNYDSERPDHVVLVYKNDEGRYARLVIRDDSRLPLEQLRADWDVNVRCLYKLGGCEDARQILPTLGNNPISNQQ